MNLYKTSNIFRFFIALLLTIPLSTSIRSQEMWGMVNSNFAGSAGLSINPSSLVNSKLYMDIHLVSGDIFVDNNYLYIHKEDYSLFKMLRGDAPAYGKNNNAFDRFINTERKNAYMNIRIQGPSFMLVQGDHAFAFHTAFRSVLRLKSMPYEITNFLYEGLEYTPQHNINYRDYNFSLTNMEWTELGLTYSRVIHKRGLDRFTGGITLKYLSGIAGGYLNARSIDYVVLDDSTINVHNLDAEIGYSIPIDYQDNDVMLTDPLFKGRGFGADIGFTFVRTKRVAESRTYSKLCRQAYPDYYYRIGVSLMDIGMIKFSKNAQKQKFDNNSAYLDRLDTLNYYNLSQITEYLSSMFYSDPDASLQGNSISIALPSAVSAQLDYQFRPDWYINASAVVPFPMGRIWIKRPYQLSLTPRYENWLYEVSLPVSLYDMKYPRIGLAARFAFLTIGTDKLGGFFGLSDFTGMDIYFAIKINFTKGRCPFTGRATHCYNAEYGYSSGKRK